MPYKISKVGDMWIQRNFTDLLYNVAAGRLRRERTA